MKFQFDDGGRIKAGFKGKTGDCAVRAIAIGTGLPYREVYDAVNKLARDERVTARKLKRSNSRTGVYAKTVNRYLESLGWEWVPTMRIGTGCKVHVKSEELPSGRLILRLSRHFAAVIDGVLHDTYDSSREGNRCVYGYWILIGNYKEKANYPPGFIKNSKGEWIPQPTKEV